jgi:hypothetical protein
MTQQIVDTCVETQLAPTLSKGDVVILDNLRRTRVRKPPRVWRKGTWILFLARVRSGFEPN